MLSWFRTLISHHPKNPEQELSSEERRIIKWINKMVPRANRYLNAHYGNILFNELLFLFREPSKQIELWLTDDRSGQSCLDLNTRRIVLIGSIDITDWRPAWTTILRHLREISRDNKHKYYCRVTIESTPEHPMHEIHHMMTECIILWHIKPCANLIVNLPSEPRVNRDAPIFHCGALPDFSEDGDRSK